MEKADNRPKVSVIIPVYNVENYLRPCLDSIVNQTLKKIEIICVDDGSTDGSLKILEKYAQQDKRITVLTQKNSGVSVARNKGIEIAKGKYVSFIDSDDWLDLDFYEKLYALSNHGDIDVIKGNMNLIKNGKIVPYTSINNNIKNNTGHLAVRFYYQFSTAIYKKALLSNNNILFKQVTFGEDNDFLCRVLCLAKTYAQSDETFYNYLQHEKSTMHCMKVRYLNDMCLMIHDILATLDKYNVAETDKAFMARLKIKELVLYQYYFDTFGIHQVFEENLLEIILYLNKQNIKDNKYKRIHTIKDLRKYLDNRGKKISVFKIFGCIPLLSVEEQ